MGRGPVQVSEGETHTNIRIDSGDYVRQLIFNELVFSCLTLPDTRSASPNQSQ